MLKERKKNTQLIVADAELLVSLWETEKRDMIIHCDSVWSICPLNQILHIAKQFGIENNKDSLHMCLGFVRWKCDTYVSLFQHSAKKTPFYCNIIDIEHTIENEKYTASRPLSIFSCPEQKVQKHDYNMHSVVKWAVMLILQQCQCFNKYPNWQNTRAALKESHPQLAWYVPHQTIIIFHFLNSIP